MTLQRQQLGKSGEDPRRAGAGGARYVILARRYRTRHGEIDIVAQEGETLVFVEVKARATAEFGTAAEAVTAHKRRRLTAMAVDYLARTNWTNRPCRFDVVAIDDVETSPTITVYSNAFEATS